MKKALHFVLAAVVLIAAVSCSSIEKMAKMAVEKVRSGEYKKEENVVSHNPDGSTTYRIQMENIKR